ATLVAMVAATAVAMLAATAAMLVATAAAMVAATAAAMVADAAVVTLVARTLSKPPPAPRSRPPCRPRRSSLIEQRRLKAKIDPRLAAPLLAPARGMRNREIGLLLEVRSFFLRRRRQRSRISASCRSGRRHKRRLGVTADASDRA